MDFKKLPRCGARAKSNFGLPCRHVALKNGRCHYHGGKVPVKNGRYTKLARMERTEQRRLITTMRNTSLSLEELVK